MTAPWWGPPFDLALSRHWRYNIVKLRTMVDPICYTVHVMPAFWLCPNRHYTIGPPPPSKVCKNRKRSQLNSDLHKTFRITSYWSTKMIYNIKDDPVLHTPSQEPSMSSKYGIFFWHFSRDHDSRIILVPNFYTWRSLRMGSSLMS